MLGKMQFNALAAIETSKKTFTQRGLAAQLGLSLGAVNKIITFLNNSGFLNGMLITEAGKLALEPYRVKRAIFLAAGFGSRLVPLTLTTPKPLVQVCGVRMIDTLLDAVCRADIEEIFIVRGYLGEKFDILKNKYPHVRFIENNLYNEANNISSAFMAKDLLQNAYVLEADLVLSNPDLIRKYEYCSNYLGVAVEKTDDWCFKLSGNRIIKMAVGGTDCAHMYGISYWSKEDGERLGRDIEKVYCMPGGKERFWDQVALDYFVKDYHVEVRFCTFDDIVEIDSLADLKKIDKSYS